MILDADYYNWLVSQVKVDPSRYKGLFQCLHAKEFFWIVPNDDNRVADALEIRVEFYNWLGKRDLMPSGGASVLEVIIALSRRMGFMVGNDSDYWAWQFIENLGLHKMTDPFGPAKQTETEEILNALIWRTYEKNGTGGFFPLPRSREDQTKIEIWYQMNAFVQENQLV